MEDEGNEGEKGSLRFNSPFDALRAAVERKGVGPGVEALFFDGLSRYRIADYSFLFLHLADKEGHYVVRKLRILLPPDSLSGSEAEMYVAIGESFKRHIKIDISPNDFAWVKQIVEVKKLRDLTSDNALGEISASEPHSVVVLVSPDLLRGQKVQIAPERLRTPEDLWVPHFVEFLKRAAPLAAEAQCCVYLDIPVPIPRDDNYWEAIMGIDGIGVGEFANQGFEREREQIDAQIKNWDKIIEAGDTTSVLSKIDGLTEIDEEQKSVLKIQVLSRAGLHVQAATLIQAILPDIIETTQGELLLRFARIADAGGEEAVAIQLLTRAADVLRVQEAIEDALAFALDLNLTEVHARCLEVLSQNFPLSSAKAEHALQQSWTNGDYTTAISLLHEGTIKLPPGAKDFYVNIFSTLSRTDQPDYWEIVHGFEDGAPWGRSRAAYHCMLDAERREAPVEGLIVVRLVSPFDAFAGEIVRVMQRLMKALFALGWSKEPDLIVPYFDWNLAYLAKHPKDHRARQRLIGLSSASVAGVSGLGILLYMFRHSFRAPDIDPEWPRAPKDLVLDEEFEGFLHNAIEWLSSSKNVVVGQTSLPTHLLSEPADDLYWKMNRVLDLASNRLEDDDAFMSLEVVACLTMAAARASSRPAEEISTLRLLGSRLAISARQQRARDFAEVALSLGAKDEVHARLAWVAFADIYHRLTSLADALVGVLCSRAIRVPISNEQAWYEAEIAARVARDFDLYDVAQEIIESGKKNLEAAGLADSQRHRVHVLDLTMEYRTILQSGSNETIGSFISDAVECCQMAEMAHDDPTPPAMLLGQALRLARLSGKKVPEGAEEYFSEVIEKASEPLRTYTKIISADNPTYEQFRALVAKAEVSRSSHNAGFDFSNLAVISHHLIGTPDALEKPEVIFYCIELSADRGADFKIVGEERRAALRVPASAEEVGGWVADISRCGVEVVGLGVSESKRLVRVSTLRGNLLPPVVEPIDLFSFDRHAIWAKRFPYSFKEEEENVYLEMRGLGLSDMPDGRVVVVTDFQLQSLPFNLLLVQNELLGRSRAVAVVPSLSWLMEARARKDNRTGIRRAWIPLEGRADGTLGFVAGRIQPYLERYDIQLDTSGKTPVSLGRMDIAIVVAHGGVHENERFFSIVSDDTQVGVHADALAGALSETRLVVLFVCSAGRFDRDLVSSTTVGLTKQLLDKGCSTVIASPWPLDSNVPANWLPSFLDSWLGKGVAVVDANFSANKAVKDALGDVPSKWLAMSVFGDPFLVANDVNETQEPGRGA